MADKPMLRGAIYPGGYDGRYRLYTVDDVPFNRFPEYPAGPSTVVVDGWSKSTSSLSRIFSSPSVVAADDGLHKLRLTRHDGTGAVVERHALDGGKYRSQREATRAAYEAGCLAFMVYEKDADRYGLNPTGEALVYVIQRMDPDGPRVGVWRDEDIRAQVDKGEAQKLRADMRAMHHEAIKWRVDSRTVTVNDQN